MFYKIVEIAAAATTAVAECLGSSVERNGVGSNLAVHLDFFSSVEFFWFWQFAFALDRICVVIGYATCLGFTFFVCTGH